VSVSGVSVEVRACVRTVEGLGPWVEVPVGFSVPVVDGLVVLHPGAEWAAAAGPLFGSVGDAFVGVPSDRAVRVALRVAAANGGGVVVHGRGVPAVWTGLAVGVARWRSQTRRDAGRGGAVVMSAVRPAFVDGVQPVSWLLRLEDGTTRTVWELMPLADYLTWRRGTVGGRV
jgi:hypothetical protein